jgi:hypothetical protein
MCTPQPCDNDDDDDDDNDDLWSSNVELMANCKVLSYRSF